MRATILLILAFLALSGTLPAQSPMPVVVQAATPGNIPSRAPVAPDNAGSVQAALKMLEEMKAANEETLRKQAATLQQLDELEKTAEQIKVYTKRG
jgi:hypothetical protein